MMVTFQNLDDFLTELGIFAERLSGVANDAAPVRFDKELIESESKRESSPLLVGVFGFIDDRFYYEARIECGYKTNGRGGECMADKEYGSLVDRLTKFCAEKCLKLRAGRWRGQG